MWGIAYVVLIWALIVLGAGLLVTGLAFEAHKRSALGLLLLVAALAVTFVTMTAKGLST